MLTITCSSAHMKCNIICKYNLIGILELPNTESNNRRLLNRPCCSQQKKCIEVHKANATYELVSLCLKNLHNTEHTKSHMRYSKSMHDCMNIQT